MKRIIAINLIIFSLIIVLFPKNHITGGVNAAESYAELYIYDVQIENNASKVVTTMTVMAPNEADALKNVSLNGWTVIRATRRIIPDNQTEPMAPPKQLDDLTLDNVILDIPKKVQLDNALVDDSKKKPLYPKGNAGPMGPSGVGRYPNGTANNGMPNGLGAPNGSLPNGAMPNGLGNPNGRMPGGSSDNGEVMVGFDANGNKVMDNLNLLPTSPELELKMTLYYKLGVVTPMLDSKILAEIEKLPKDAHYVLFGNADIVRVGKNASYDTNYELSYLRADYIKKMMERKGFIADNIIVIGLGTRYPLVESKTGHVKNRRVEIYGFRS